MPRDDSKRELEFVDGVIISHTIKQFTWIDRIRILFGCGFHIGFKVNTQHEVGRTQIEYANLYVERFWTYTEPKGATPISNNANG